MPGRTLFRVFSVRSETDQKDQLLMQGLHKPADAMVEAALRNLNRDAVHDNEDIR